MSKTMYKVCIKYSMCDLTDNIDIVATAWCWNVNTAAIRINESEVELVTSLLAVFAAAIWVKSTHLIKSCLKTRKKISEEIKDIFT